MSQQNSTTASASASTTPADPSTVTLSNEEIESLRQKGRVIGDYALLECIGNGSFGKVRRGVHIPTKQRVAVKMLNRQALASGNMDKKIRREIKILKLFNHAHICRLYDVLYTPGDIFVVIEYCGKELYDHIVHHGKLDEPQARHIFQQIVCAIEYCHHFRVVHRDLKPENILYESQTKTAKLIDFGLANIMEDGQFLRTSCGSPNYAAPEVISGKLYAGPEVDVWSCGVVLFALLCGCLPFDEDNIPALFSKIKRGKYSIPSHVSPEAHDLINQILVVDPVQRITVPQIRDHPWFAHRLPKHLYYRPSLFYSNNHIDEGVTEEVADLLIQLNMSSSHNKKPPAAFLQQIAANKSGSGSSNDNSNSSSSKQKKLLRQVIFREIREAVARWSQPSHDANNEAGGVGIVSPSRFAVVYTVLLNAQRQREILSAHNQPDDVASVSSGTTVGPGGVSASQAELNQGLILSVSPAISLLLDHQDATTNKRAYNSTQFLPGSAHQAIKTNNSSSPAVSNSSFTSGGGISSNNNSSSAGGFSGGGAGGSFSNPTGLSSFSSGQPLQQNQQTSFPQVSHNNHLSGLGAGGGSLSGNNTIGQSPGGGFAFSSKAMNSGPSSFSERVGSFQQARSLGGSTTGSSLPLGVPNNSLRSPNLMGIQGPTGSGNSAGGISPHLGAAANPNSNNNNNNNSQGNSLSNRPTSLVGVAAQPHHVYGDDEQLFHVQNNTGWRVGLMTDKRSADAISEICLILKMKNMEWKVINSYLLAVRKKRSQQQQQQQQQQAGPGSKAGSGDDNTIIQIHLLRMQERHDKGFVVDFFHQKGCPMAALEMTIEIWKELLRRLG